MMTLLNVRLYGSVLLLGLLAITGCSSADPQTEDGPREMRPVGGKADDGGIDCVALCMPRDTHDAWCFDTAECVVFCEANIEESAAGEREAFLSCVTDAPLCYQSVEQCMGSSARAECAEQCASRDEHAGDGWCVSSDECAIACEAGASTWSADEKGAFDTCISDAPLCYRTLDDCMSSVGEASGCEARCESRDAHSADGWCLSTDECVTACEASEDTWSDAESAAFDTCVSDAPLCFRTIDDCIATETITAECTTRCAGRDGHAVDGWCLPTDECVTECAANLEGWTAEEADAFQTCVAEAPLCFRTLEQCIAE